MDTSSERENPFPPDAEQEAENPFQYIDNLKEKLDSYRPLPPEMVKNLKSVFDLDWTYNSNAIEGNTLTFEETEVVLRDGITIGGKTLREHLEVINHQEAINLVMEMAQENRPIAEEDINAIHSIVLARIDPDNAGRYRQVPVIVGRDCLPPEAPEVPGKMEAFASWLNSPEAGTLHPVERAVRAHNQLLVIHPFIDGNGRTARLLMNLILIKEGFPPAVIQQKHRKEYISAMREVNNDNYRPIRQIITFEVQRSLDRYLTLAELWAKGKETQQSGKD